MNFGTDAWTSPNHKPYVGITVHYQKGGEAKSMLLDIVEVSVSHTGKNLAAAFSSVIHEFGIEDKVS